MVTFRADAKAFRLSKDGFRGPDSKWETDAAGSPAFVANSD